MIRIRMPKGHLELSLGGVNYKPDEDGAFNVPDEHAKLLLEVHGGVIEPTVQDLEAEADAADLRVAQIKWQLEVAVTDAKAAREKAEKAKTKSAVKPDPTKPDPTKK